MQEPLQITFRHMSPSEAVEADIRAKVEKLDLLYDRITGCHVTVEAPHQHHHQGKLFQIKIDLFLPGKVIVVDRERGLNHAHEDPYVAIRDAFDAIKRQLQDYIRQRRLNIKTHQKALIAKVKELFPFEDYGFLETPEGREVYFHRNSVLNGGFNQLDIGSEVSFHEEMGKKGPQASSVARIK